VINYKLLVVSECVGEGLFGVSEVVMDLLNRMPDKGISVHVIAGRVEQVPSNLANSVSKSPLLLSETTKFKWHPRQKSYIKKVAQSFGAELIHIHGVFSPIQLSAIKAASELKIPVIVSYHGMLEPWLWMQKGAVYYWMKRVYWGLLIKPVMKRVDFVHAITDQESETLECEFPRVPQIKISNAIDLSEFSSNQMEPDVDRYLLFIGRLHPKKGVDLLIEAFKKSVVGNVRLVIAGPDFDVDYTARLKALVENIGLSERTSFVGSVHGEQKSELLQKAWCTVIPSYSEAVGLVNLESAASFTPTITTTMTGLSDWQEGGGLLVEPELEPLTSAIVTACNWSQDKRMLMGKRARSFVEERYSWDVIGEQWVEAYKMIAESREGAHE